MGNGKQSDRGEAVRDAVTGYTVVVLAIVCFLLALVVLVAGVRFVVGLGGSSNVGAAAAVPVTTSVGAEPETQAASEAE